MQPECVGFKSCALTIYLPCLFLSAIIFPHFFLSHLLLSSLDLYHIFLPLSSIYSVFPSSSFHAGDEVVWQYVPQQQKE